MKKKINLALSIILSFGMVSILNVSAYANTNYNTSIQNNNDIEVKDITYEEYIKVLAENKNMTYEEASKFDAEQNKEFNSKYGLRDKEYLYRTVSRTFTYGNNTNFSARLEATLKISGNYIYYQIDDCGGVWTRPNSGQYSYTWEETNASYESSNLPDRKITLFGSGYFVITTSNSVSGGVSIPGFELSGSTGSNLTYYSNTMDMRYTYDLYN